MMDCLGTPLILREIFQNLTSIELLELSLVNKQWNYEARCLMRGRGDLSANINKNQTSQHLRALASDLRRMKQEKKIIPFSGMSIAVKGFHWGERLFCKHYSETGQLDKVYEELLDQMTWRNLMVSLDWTGDKCDMCKEYLFVERVFKKYCSVFEQLSLQDEFGNAAFHDFVLPRCSFPRLKTFRLQKTSTPRTPGYTSEYDTQLVKKMVSLAPNLQVLHTGNRTDLQANLLEGSSAVHVTDHEYFLSLDEIPQCAVNQVKLKQMRLESICQSFNAERFNRITSTLLQNSRTTLSSMEIAAIILVPLARYKVCLPQVRALCLGFTAANLESRPPRLWRILKSFDFTRVFPNSTTVRIFWLSNSDYESVSNAFNVMVEQENAAFMEPMPDRAANIKSLRLQLPAENLDYSTELLVQMFPDIQQLTIRAHKMVPFTRIWKSWLDLKELDISFRGSTRTEKFDDVFCGIFPEEVALLQKQDEEYLRRVNIVPVMPSINCFKGLRTFNLSFEQSHHFRGPLDDPTFVLSKVTGLIAFQRCPALTVTLTTNTKRRTRALSHLKPYATVVRRCRTDW